MKIKVLIVEDHDLVREGISALLENDPEIEIVGEAENGVVAIEKTALLDPHVLLMDLSMPVMNGLECTKQIKIKYPGVKILVLSMHDDEDYLTEMMMAGAEGYILKNTKRDELASAIKKIAHGGTHIGCGFKLKTLVTYKLNQELPKEISAKELNITEREMDVLKLVAEGLTNVEMAQKLFTSVRTIETRRKNLLDKTNTVNTATLIKFAVLNGLIK